MNRLILVLTLLFVVSFGTSAQQTISVPLAVELPHNELDQHLHAGRAIPGCRFFMEKNAELAKYAQDHPEILEQQKLMKRTRWTFNVNDPGPTSGGWWATDLSEAQDFEYIVPSTCRAVGNNCYIFVENSLWNSGDANQAAVDSILAAWESRTPADPTKGIYQIDVETFGNPPNVDGDNKIIILIMDIKDGSIPGGGYVAGYYFNLNQFPDPQTVNGATRRSNVAEIYYLDGKQSDLTSPNGINTASSTTAHEFQHMINWEYNKSSDTFNNESASEVASLVCGYAYSSQGFYTNNTDVNLTEWTGTLADYSRAGRWGLYLWNQFPNDYLKKWVQNAGLGITRMDNAFAAYPTDKRFTEVFVDWLVANELQDQSVLEEYGYTYQGSLTKPQATTYLLPTTNGTVIASVSRLGADYISFTGGTDLSITFTGQAADLKVIAIKEGASDNIVEEIDIGSPYVPSGFGTTYSSVTFVVVNLSTTTNQPYTYNATGGGGGQQTVEFKWDNTEPTFYYALAPLDTLCVLFQAVPGARLDSIRVALRRSGTMNGGIWTLGGSTPLGTPLIKPISVSTNSTPSVIQPGATYPYPIPYPNWKSVDLRAHKVTLDENFAVGFWFEADTSTAAYVMATVLNASGPYYNYAYLHNPSSGSPNWYYLSPGPDSEGQDRVSLWLIRAYASIGTPVGTEVIELLPASFSLQQNYPNPFNPSTTIRYDLPTEGHVKLQIYDMLGRVVKTLIDSEQQAGSHQAQWDGTNFSGTQVSSGVYFYKLESGSFNEIKRMVLMK